MWNLENRMRKFLFMGVKMLRTRKKKKREDPLVSVMYSKMSIPFNGKR